jgi:hypothetical protein
MNNHKLGYGGKKNCGEIDLLKELELHFQVVVFKNRCFFPFHQMWQGEIHENPL